MKKAGYTLIAIVFLFFACQEVSKNSSSEKTTIAKAQNVSNEIANDSIRPKTKVSYHRNSSRAKSEIKQDFPYDIDLKKADGTIVNSANLLKKDGRPTVLLFWLTTCYPCRLELAAIQKSFDKWQAETDFNLLAISTDFVKNYPNFVKKVEESNWSFEAYHDFNREFRNVIPGALNGLPQVFIFDKEGKIVYHKRKYHSGDELKMYEKLKEISL